MKTEHRVLILAAGEGTRWENYLNVPKHLVEIDNEPIVYRTARQFLSYTSDVWIVSKNCEYSYPGAHQFSPPVDPLWSDFAKYRSCRELWSDGRTVLAFGDVYYSDAAIHTIASTPGQIMFFLRPNHSTLTGGRPEIFTLAFDGSAHERIDSALDQLIRGKVPPPGAWRTYRHIVRPHYTDNNMHTVIDDETTDFDFPHDYDRFLELRR